VVYKYDLAGNRTSKIFGGWKTAYTLGDGNRLASTTVQAATNTLFVSGTANEPIGTDPRWGEIWITNLTAGAGGFPSVNGNSFFAELPALAGQTNTLHIAIPDQAGNMGYATTDVFVPSAGSTPTTSSYSYNAAGCVTNLNGVSLDWDERYRLTSVDDASSFVEYEYDVLNRRTSRIEGGTTNHFVYDGNQVVADLDGNGDLLRTYVWGMGIDNLLCFTDHTTSNTYYAIKDHQNSVVALADDTGSVVESYEYVAWGSTRVFDASNTELTASAYGNRYCFQGRENDWSTGLIYFRARWYNPETGRWLSKDPIGISGGLNPGGLNQYVFCGNNPINAVDPSGLADVSLVPSTDGRYNESVNYIESGGSGFVTVNTHGGSNGDGNSIMMDNGNGGWTTGSGADVAAAIQNGSSTYTYSAGDIPILFICDSGKGSVAQDVANILRTLVIAPNGVVDSNGNIWTTMTRWHMNLSPDGTWNVIYPNNCSE